MLRCWNDHEVTTEHGAYGIAILLIRAHADQTVVKRARKGPGFDYWLGQSDDPLFQNKARLEVSGIRKGNPRAVTRRMNQKLKQIRENDKELPAYVVIVEFSQPLSRMALKEEEQ